MAITTRQQLTSRAQYLTEGIRKRASALSEASNLFLSHSSKDRGPLLDGAIRVLTKHGAIVYADVLDPEAKRLKPPEFGQFFSDVIADTERLVALVTARTSTSRWVPWELGLAHGVHEFYRAAVWPVIDSDESVTWTHQEYLAIYPRIEWVKLRNEYQWGVRDPHDGRYWPLSTWLAL